MRRESLFNSFLFHFCGFLYFVNGVCAKRGLGKFSFLHFPSYLTLFVKISFSVLLVAIDGGFLEPYNLCSRFVFIITSWNTDPKEWVFPFFSIQPPTLFLFLFFFSSFFFFSSLHLYLRHHGGVFFVLFRFSSFFFFLFFFLFSFCSSFSSIHIRH